MTEQTPGGGSEGIERGASEETSGAPLKPAEEETSGRPAADQPHEEEGELMAGSPPAWGGQRPEEFNPDDFE